MEPKKPEVERERKSMQAGSEWSEGVATA